MFRISCFADEISPELSEQISVMNKNNVKFLELRGVWNKNVLDLSDDELGQIKEQLDANGIQVSSIGSPIGKVDINDDFGKHLDRFQRAMEVALKMNSRFIRIFSFYIPKEERSKYEDTVIERMAEMIRLAGQNNLMILHENEGGIFGETSDRCQQLFTRIQAPNFRAVFDPSNFVTAGEDVWAESFARMQPYIEYMHIKDSVRGIRGAVPAGEGDGHVGEILNALRDRDGMFLSLEPHLAEFGRNKGFTGPDLFVRALEALTLLLNKYDIAFS